MSRGSGNDFSDDIAGYVGETEVAPIVAIGQFFVIDAEQMQDGRVQIIDADAIDDGLVSEFVGLAVTGAGLDAATGEPGGESMRIVVSAGASLLDDGQTAEFAVADDQRRLEQAALFEIGKKAGNRRIGLGREAAVVLDDVGVAVPASLVFHPATVDLNETHAALHQPPGHEHLASEMGALRVVEPRVSGWSEALG